MQLGAVSASLAALRCLLRGLPLFFRSRPKTPLRVLCLIALDTVRVLRNSHPLPRHRLQELAAALDFGAGANAALDHKAYCREEHQAARLLLEEAGLGPQIDDYVRQLRELEIGRPAPGREDCRFEEVRSYRESVARLSLGLVAALALDHDSLEQAIRAIGNDLDLAILFRIVMLCQIIDDLVDYGLDVSAELPSFLTASVLLPGALELTSQAARSYSQCGHSRQSAGLFPLRVALSAVAALTQLMIRVGPRRNACRRQPAAAPIG